MAPTEVQHTSGFATGGSQTFAATLTTPATAGNLLIYMVGGDKDIGTLTLSGYTLDVNLRSTSTSLVIGHKTAVGGETTVTGTVTGANTAGSAVWVFEWTESGSGPWEVKASASNNTNETNVTTTSSGTTGSVTSAGRAIAAFSSDSVITEGTVSYSNSFTAVASTPSGGGGNAGFWAADKVIASGTAETTITRTGGSADQMSGGIVVFGRAVAQDISPSGMPSVATGGPITVSNTIQGVGGIASAENFGTSDVTSGTADQTVTVSGIGSAEAFGATRIGGPIIFPTSIVSAEAFGATRFIQAPTRVQSKYQFLPKNTFDFTISYEDQAAVAGNAIVFIGAFHHDIGTFTLSGSNWNYAVNLRSFSLSLVIAWKTAAGGETGVTGHFTQGNDTGSNMLLLEYASQAPGQWAQLGLATNNTDETNVLVWPSGTTGALVGDGIGIAGFGLGNLGPDSTDNFSNSYNAIFTQGGGQFESGVFAADKVVPFGATTTTTLTRSGAGVAHKMSGGLLALGKSPVQTIVPTGIASGEAFGATELPAQPQPPSIPSAETFGAPVVAILSLNISPAGIPSGEAIGEHVIHSGPVLFVTGSITSAEAFGTALVANGVRHLILGPIVLDKMYLGATRPKVYAGATLVFQ